MSVVSVQLPATSLALVQRYKISIANNLIWNCEFLYVLMCLDVRDAIHFPKSTSGAIFLLRGTGEVNVSRLVRDFVGGVLISTLSAHTKLNYTIFLPASSNRRLEPEVKQTRKENPKNLFVWSRRATFFCFWIIEQFCEQLGGFSSLNVNTSALSSRFSQPLVSRQLLHKVVVADRFQHSEVKRSGSYESRVRIWVNRLEIGVFLLFDCCAIKIKLIAYQKKIKQKIWVN